MVRWSFRKQVSVARNENGLNVSKLFCQIGLENKVEETKASVGN